MQWRRKAAAVCTILLLLAGSGAVVAHNHSQDAPAGEGAGGAVTVDGRFVVGQAEISKDMSEVLVPVRGVAQAFGASVNWDNDHQAILIDTPSFPQESHARMHDIHGEMQVAPQVYLRGKLLEPNIPPVMVNGTMMIQADTLAAPFGATVRVNAGTHTVEYVTKEAVDTFQRQEANVRDALNGKGMVPHVTADGVKEFTLTAGLSSWSPIKGVLTTAWSYNGQVPGSVIRVTEGDKVRIKLINKLPEATTIHWHGLHLPNAMDGVPGVTQPSVAPGQSFIYEFTVSHAGTFMYHAHYDDMKQVASGLYGAFIIDPKTAASETKYDHDYTMVIARTHVNNDLESEPDFFTINGRSYPDLPAIDVKKDETVRVRLINIDPKEVHTMHLHGIDFQVIAKDGHTVPSPMTMNTVMIGPGETYDIAFKADAVGKWMFHCHILDHTMNPGGTHSEMGGLITIVNVTE